MGISSNFVLRLGLIPVTALMLAACQEGMMQSGATQPGQEASDTGGAVKYEERDVEKPEVFQYTGKALWDGRPSLGGVWVAHPNVKLPERVMIVNISNGKSVVGALFRREANMPGPRMQLSSDAATAIGVLAGSPTDLKVTALRRESVQIAAKKPAEPAPAKEPEKVEAKAPAAVKAADDTKSKAIKTAAVKPAAKPAAQPVAKPPVKAAAAAAAKPPVKAAAAPAPVAKPAAKPPSKPAATGLPLPYVQIGFFSVQENATSAAADLKKKGLAAKVVPMTIKGKPYWRVLAGPAGSVGERANILKTVKGMGFKDAYAVRG